MACQECSRFDCTGCLPSPYRAGDPRTRSIPLRPRYCPSHLADLPVVDAYQLADGQVEELCEEGGPTREPLLNQKCISDLWPAVVRAVKDALPRRVPDGLRVEAHVDDRHVAGRKSHLQTLNHGGVGSRSRWRARCSPRRRTNQVTSGLRSAERWK